MTILFGLRDIAGGNTSNLVATLLQTNGITNVASAQSYGVLIDGGPTVSRPFTFTAMGTNGQNLTATLTLQDGARNLGTVAFGFTLGGGTVSFSDTNTIFLPENPVPPTIASNSVPPGYGYPSIINVSGIAGTLTKVTATLSNFGHTFPSDVDVVLRAPDGSNSILMSHCGGSASVRAVTLTFDQAASNYLPTNQGNCADQRDVSAHDQFRDHAQVAAGVRPTRTSPSPRPRRPILTAPISPLSWAPAPTAPGLCGPSVTRPRTPATSATAGLST